jgi:hypothetical protein
MLALRFAWLEETNNIFIRSIQLYGPVTFAKSTIEEKIYMDDIFISITLKLLNNGVLISIVYSQTCIKRSPFRTKKKWPFKAGDPIKEVMKFSMTGQEKGDPMGRFDCTWLYRCIDFNNIRN